MSRQRNMAQMKEQNKTPGKELNKMETNSDRALSSIRSRVQNTGY